MVDDCNGYRIPSFISLIRLAPASKMTLHVLIGVCVRIALENSVIAYYGIGPASATYSGNEDTRVMVAEIIAIAFEDLIFG